MAVLKLLRNSELYATREAAISGIQTKAATLSDGEMWLATWGTQQENKSILAVKRTWGVTIFDLDAINGEISGEIDDLKEQLKPIAFSGSASDAATEEITASETTVAVAGENVAAQIADLAQTMKSIQDNASKYKLVQLTADEVAELGDENVKEAYKVVTYQGEETEQTVYTQVGGTVKIYKDSALQEVYLGSDADSVDATTGVITKQTVTDPQSMNFVYQLADGTYSMTKIDVSKFLTESEFGDGLQVANAVVSVKIDSSSETDSQATSAAFLSVSENGVKISGIKDEINRKIAELGTTVGSTTVETGKHVAVQIVEEHGVLTGVTVTEDNIASAADVAEIERVTSAALNDLELRKAEKSDLNVLAKDVLEGVVAGKGINVGVKSNKTQEVSVKLDTVQTDNALVLGANGLYVSQTIDCGTY